MNTSPSPAQLDAPLRQAQKTLGRIQATAQVGVFLPVPILAAAAAGVMSIDRSWFHDPFLPLFLGLIFVIFVVGQIAALFQMWRMLPAVKGAARTLEILQAGGDDPNLESLRVQLHEVPSGHVRNLVLRWIELGMQGRTDGAESLLEDALERRSIDDSRILSLHTAINRTTLKLGFLGTLIGIILTFPPMKRAVLGLSSSDGELKFIKDIALAIDGDQYAILSTLIATGISILVEFVTIQMLERILMGFDLVQSHVNDWNTLCLQPSLHKYHNPESRAVLLEKTQERMELALIQAQKTMEGHLRELSTVMRAAGAQLDQVVGIQEAVAKRLDDLDGYERLVDSMAQAQRGLEKHLAAMTEALKTASGQLGQVTDVQSLVGKRVSELSEYEKQYRLFLASKQQATAPAGLRGET